MKNRPLTLFYLVTFGFSWTLWGLMLASQSGLLPIRVPVHWSGSFGPAIGALTVIGVTAGKSGLRNLGRSFFKWRASPAVWFVALAGIVLWSSAATLIAAVVSGVPLALNRFEKWGEFLLYFPVILVVGGPLGEEVGWRGFLQPHLQERYSANTASFLVGLTWSLWHLPLVWLEGAAQKGSSALAFSAVVLPMAFLFAWVLESSAGSLLLPLLFHTSINTVSYLVLPAVLGPIAESPVYTYSFIAILWISAATLIARSGRRTASRN